VCRACGRATPYGRKTAAKVKICNQADTPSKIDLSPEKHRSMIHKRKRKGGKGGERSPLAIQK